MNRSAGFHILNVLAKDAGLEENVNFPFQTDQRIPIHQMERSVEHQPTQKTGVSICEILNISGGYLFKIEGLRRSYRWTNYPAQVIITLICSAAY